MSSGSIGLEFSSCRGNDTCYAEEQEDFVQHLGAFVVEVVMKIDGQMQTMRPRCWWRIDMSWQNRPCTPGPTSAHRTPQRGRAADESRKSMAIF